MPCPRAASASSIRRGSSSASSRASLPGLEARMDGRELHRNAGPRRHVRDPRAGPSIADRRDRRHVALEVALGVARGLGPLAQHVVGEAIAAAPRVARPAPAPPRWCGPARSCRPRMRMAWRSAWRINGSPERATSRLSMPAGPEPLSSPSSTTRPVSIRPEGRSIDEQAVGGAQVLLPIARPRSSRRSAASAVSASGMRSSASARHIRMMPSSEVSPYSCMKASTPPCLCRLARAARTSCPPAGDAPGLVLRVGGLREEPGDQACFLGQVELGDLLAWRQVHAHGLLRAALGRSKFAGSAHACTYREPRGRPARIESGPCHPSRTPRLRRSGLGKTRQPRPS